VICGVVLAAGAGRRFAAEAGRGGAAIKQLAPLDGRPLLEHALRAMSEAAVDTRLLVLGAHAPEIRAAVDLFGHEVVPCADWAQGMGASLRAGAAAAHARGAGAIVVTLGDQPQITPAAISRIAGAWDGRTAAVRATYGGAPGHPILLAATLFEAIAQLRGDHGARDILRDADVLAVACDDLGSAGDVDRPSDLTALHASRGQE
jgi:molybdenum cofactor cytidylyltransferase